MTLSGFIESGGIPADDMFYLYHPRVFDGMLDSASNKAYLNRRFECGTLTRIARKLFYDRGLGCIPMDKASLDAELLFWGMHDGDIMLPSVRSLLAQLAKKSTREHVIVVGATDDSFTQSYVSLIPEQVMGMFVLNCAADHPKVHWYPLGRDGSGIQSFGIAPRADKQIKAYCNFSPNTHADRKTILDMIGDRDFVTCIDVEGYGLYTGYPMSNQEFLRQLNDHAFCICPRGAGYDTFRLWDSLHLGVIPIMVREAGFHKHLDNLPVLFLDSIEEFAKLSKCFLEEKHGEMLETEYDFSILTAGYWERRFRGLAE